MKMIGWPGDPNHLIPSGTATRSAAARAGLLPGAPQVAATTGASPGHRCCRRIWYPPSSAATGTASCVGCCNWA